MRVRRGRVVNDFLSPVPTRYDSVWWVHLPTFSATEFRVPNDTVADRQKLPWCLVNESISGTLRVVPVLMGFGMEAVGVGLEPALSKPNVD